MFSDAVCVELLLSVTGEQVTGDYPKIVPRAAANLKMQEDLYGYACFTVTRRFMERARFMAIVAPSLVLKSSFGLCRRSTNRLRLSAERNLTEVLQMETNCMSLGRVHQPISPKFMRHYL